MAESKMGKYAKRLSNPNLRCENGCGFYGNAIYMGYCSKCYKELVRDVPLSASVLESQAVNQPEVDNDEDGDLDLGLGKLMSRRKFLAAAKRRGRMLRGRGSNSKVEKIDKSQSASSNGVVSSPNKKSTESAIPTAPTSSGADFAEFLNSLKKPAAQDIIDQLQAFSKQSKEKSSKLMSGDNLSQFVQDFYQLMSDRLQINSIYKGVNEDQQAVIMAGCEKHIMTKLYKRAFNVMSGDDETKDFFLSHRMKMLEWVKPEHLEISLDLSKESVVTAIHKARQELLDLISTKSPLEKLQCITRCCNSLFDALRDLSSLGADNFLPTLIYTIIISRPQKLQSNINYISRFAMPYYVMSGETGYCFTNLCGAVAFIERCDANKFDISEEEFNQNMGYVNGKSDLDLMLTENYDELEDELLQTTQSCLDAMKDLRRRQQLMIVESGELAENMQVFTIGLRQQVDTILSSPPPKSYFARRFDMAKDDSPSTSSFPSTLEQSQTVVNPFLSKELIDLSSPTTDRTMPSFNSEVILTTEHR